MVKIQYKLVKKNGKIVKKSNQKTKILFKKNITKIFVKSEATAIKCYRNEMNTTKNNVSNQSLENEKETTNIPEWKPANLEPMESVFENGNIQPKSVFQDSSTSDLRNFITYKKSLIKKEVGTKSWPLSDECPKNMNFNRENNSTCTTKPKQDGNMIMESMESSPKKYPSLSVTISESANREVAVQDFDLDLVIVNHSDELITLKNINYEHKHEPNGNKVYTSNPIVKTEIKDESDSESDDTLKKGRPNRRLHAERPERVHESENREWKKPYQKNVYLGQHQKSHERKRSTSLLDCEADVLGEDDQSCSLPRLVKKLKPHSDFINARKTKDKSSIFEKKSKAAESWSEILATPELWKTESNKMDFSRCPKVKFETNFLELLNKYTDSFSVRKPRIDDECLTFWKERLDEKLKDPNSITFLMEYYIPPARVKMFEQQLTYELSSMERLHKVCENRLWPQPIYEQIPQTDNTAGFVYSCQLKSVLITPSKPASNHLLAKELAAEQCLDWLGIKPAREATDVLQDTYSVSSSHIAT